MVADTLAETLGKPLLAEARTERAELGAAPVHFWSANDRAQPVRLSREQALQERIDAQQKTALPAVQKSCAAAGRLRRAGGTGVLV